MREEVLPIATWTAMWLLILIAAQVSDQLLAGEEGTMQASKVSNREIVLTRTFAAPREAVFDALTNANQIVQWMKPANMSLVRCEVDLRAGGSFRYVFERPGGARIEVRGAYQTVDPPRAVVYTESYDFSRLRVLVTTVLDAAGNGTVFRQKLEYPSREERDEDFDGVASSAEELYARLERYLR